MKIFKHTAYTLIGAAAVLSLGACSPDEVELEPIAMELNYTIFNGDYNYTPTEQKSFEVDAYGKQIKLGASENVKIRIELSCNVDGNTGTTFDITTPDWVIAKNSDSYSWYGENLACVNLDLFGYSYENIITINGEKFETTNNRILFAFAPNPETKDRSGNIKLNVDIEGTKGSVEIPVKQTAPEYSVAPTAFQIVDNGENYYYEKCYVLNVDYPEISTSANIRLMVTPLPEGQLSENESTLRYTGAYGWMLYRNTEMELCEFRESINSEDLMNYSEIYTEDKTYPITGGTRYSFNFTNGYNFNDYSKYAVYTITERNSTVCGFNVTVFDSNGNIVE